MIIYGFYGLMKHLYIIGNGVDCHHGICSSYKAYRTWLQKHHPRLYERLSEFYATDNDEWWWEFELNLGEIDITYYIDSTAYEARPDFASDEFRDRDYHAGEIQAQNEIGKLVADIQITFSEWVGALNRPDYGKKSRCISKTVILLISIIPIRCKICTAFRTTGYAISTET